MFSLQIDSNLPNWITVVFLHILASEEVCSGQLAADPESIRTDGVLMPISDTWRSNLSLLTYSFPYPCTEACSFSPLSDQLQNKRGKYDSLAEAGMGFVFDPHFSPGILFNMDHRLLEGRRADGLVQISGKFLCSRQKLTWIAATLFVHGNVFLHRIQERQIRDCWAD